MSESLCKCKRECESVGVAVTGASRFVDHFALLHSSCTHGYYIATNRRLLSPAVFDSKLLPFYPDDDDDDGYSVWLGAESLVLTSSRPKCAAGPNRGAESIRAVQHGFH